MTLYNRHVSVLSDSELSPTATEFHGLRTLYALLAELAHADSLEHVYNAAIASLLSATAADRASILLFDEDGVMRFKASKGLSESYMQAVTGHTPWRKGERDAEPLVVPDVLLDPDLKAYEEVFQREGIRALAFIPLALNEGVTGKFMLYHSQPHEFGRDEIDLAVAIGNHIALATERKRTELAHRESEQRLQALLDNTTTVVFLKDCEGRFILVNRRFSQVFHLATDAIQGRTDAEIFPAPLAAAFRENDRRVLKTGQPLEVEEYAPHEDGVHTYISVKFPVQDAEGRIVAVGGIATDVTARKKAEATLRQVKEGLEHFAYAAAHDLQEPIRNISLAAQLLERELAATPNPLGKPHIQTIVEGSRRMQMLIQDLLTYTRTLDTPNDPRANADGEAVLREVVCNLSTAIEKSGGEITHDPLPALPIHRAHLGQLLQNLIGNALKYRSESAPRIHIAALRHSDHWLVRVQDNGMGVPEKHRDRIFGVFKRLHGPEVPGSGIGLAICARLVAVYGGRIWVENAQGGGSIFCFTLPRTNAGPAG